MNNKLSRAILLKQGDIGTLINKADHHKMRRGRTDSPDSLTSLDEHLLESLVAFGDAPVDDRIEAWKKRKKLAEKTPSPSISPSTSKKRSPSPSTPAKKKNDPRLHLVLVLQKKIKMEEQKKIKKKLVVKKLVVKKLIVKKNKHFFPYFYILNMEDLLLPIL